MAESNTNEAAAASIEAAARAKRDRSPNYPALTFTEALEKAELLWGKEKKYPMSLDTAAGHLEYSNAKNGAFQTTISALRKFGLVESAGNDVRVSDDANQIFIYPPDAPERKAIVDRLAMRPPLFGGVLQKFPDGLPSDANLRAKLQVDWGFSSAGAADTFIRALRDSMRVASVDGPVKAAENSVYANAQEADPMTLTQPRSHATHGQPMPPPRGPAPEGAEKHTWKLGDGVWAEVTITGSLGPKNLAKLKKFVELMEASEAESE